MRSPILNVVLVTSGSLFAQQQEPAPSADVELVYGASSPVVDSPALQLARQLQEGHAAIAEHVRPAIVTVRAYERMPPAELAALEQARQQAERENPGWLEENELLYPGYREFAAVTGWVVHEDGEVLTLDHVLRKADGSAPDLIDFETSDYKRVIAERVGSEPTVNLAILQGVVWPNSMPRKMRALQWADSSLLRPGHTVLAFGDPSGPERYLQVGTFVAQPARDCYQDMLSSFFMQVALVAPPEAYGGPLVNLDGRVVGILAPLMSPGQVFTDSQGRGIEFAQPSKIMMGLHFAIRQMRSFRSPWLGYSVMSRAEVANERGLEAYQEMDKPGFGILIENVYDPGPAAAAGIRPNDWLVTFDGVRISSPVDFQKQLYLAGVGATVQVGIFRGGETRSYELQIEQRPDAAKPR